MQKNKLIKILILVVAVFVVVIFVSLEMKAKTAQFPDSKSAVEFEIEKNLGLSDIASSLVEKGVLKKSNKNSFVYFILTRGIKSDLKAGKYSISPSVSPASIAQKISLGDSIDDVKITFPEGITSSDMGVLLEERGVVSSDNFEKALNNDWSSDFSWIGDVESIEGFLFPDTYMFYLNSDAESVVKKILQNFESKIVDELYVDRGVSELYDDLILASIVQNEVSKTEDMKLVASIFINRLEIGKALESDATVNFVTGKNALQPTYDDVAIDSPYNTYKNTGLPPGPIGNPGIEAMGAVINPEESDYLFFLSKEDGETVFSKTYEEHIKNKGIYLD